MQKVLEVVMLDIIQLLYRILFRPIAWILGLILMPFSEKLWQLYKKWKTFPAELRAASTKHELIHCNMRIWIHAASIGEFESVCWIVEDILKHAQKSVLVTYSSPSLGNHLDHKKHLVNHPRFAKVFFPLDNYKRLRQIRRTYTPTHFILLQYDTWPNLMTCVTESIPARIMLNFAPPPEKGIINHLKLSYLHKVLNKFTYIHQCEEAPERPLLSPELSLTHFSPHTRWVTVNSASSTDTLPSSTDPFLRLIGGNVYLSDSHFLSALFNYIAPLHYQLVWTPHETHSKNIKAIEKQLQKLCLRYSIPYRTADKASTVTSDHHPGVVLITGFGFLQELYKFAHLAYVGGGYNRKGIHNVIEPLSWGCPIVSGPFIDRQPVARWAVKMGFLKTGNENPESFHPILAEYFAMGPKHELLRNRITQMQLQMRKRARDIPNHLPIYKDPQS